jgi:hypothetical protein
MSFQNWKAGFTGVSRDFAGYCSDLEDSMRKAIFAAALLLSLPAPAHAAQMTVGDLQTICAGSDNMSEASCRFFVLGVVEGSSFGEGRKTVGGPLCIAEGVSSVRLRDAVVTAMAADVSAFPKDRSLAAAGFVAAAAMKAFPCKK